MRITGGLKKGLHLKVPKGGDLRPTSEKNRKMVFDILQDLIAGAHFLDLFAGTGAMGIEALSRGALRAVFIEKSGPAVKAIQENLAYTEFTSNAQVIKADAIQALARLNGPFDVIFIDPPYQEPNDKQLLQLIESIDQRRLLKQGGVLFVEYTAHTRINFSALLFESLRVEKIRPLGGSQLIQFSFP